MTAGRPKIIDDSVVDKLEYAFNMGCTDIEACLYAGIHRDSLYNYQKEHPEFVDRKEQLKQNPALKARTTVYNKLETDEKTAMWYLERKNKDEFSARTDQNISLQGHPTLNIITQKDE